MLAKLVVLVRIALANITSSLLNLFIGLVLLFGAALLVVGGALFTTLDESLSHSIVDSISGHLQVYGGHSKDPIELYGKLDGSDSNLSPIDDFRALKAALLTVPNVAAVVPMGASTAIISSGNTVDVTLEKLRALYRDEAAAAHPPDELRALRASRAAHVRNILSVLSKDMERARELATATEEDEESLRALGRASSPEFWDGFEADPLGHLELLENKVAPLVADSDLLFIRCLGTDLDAFQRTFSRMEVVEGQRVPRGKRGILLPRFFYEDSLKLKNARRLDKLRDALAAGRRLADPSDKELQRFVHENQAQTREIVLQLDAASTAQAVAGLQQLLASREGDLAALLREFFTVTDENFEARYRYFYERLAPMLSLYRAKVGDELTLRSFGRAGSVESATVRVYGIFELRGLEKSPLAGANALVDLVTFRDLYGLLTADQKAELEKLKAAAGAKEVGREEAEAALFGGEGSVVEEASASGAIADEVTRAGGGPKRRAETFDPRELDEGFVLHAAVMLADGSPVAQQATHEAVERLFLAQRPAPSRALQEQARAALAAGQLPFRVAGALRAALALEDARAQGQPSGGDEVLLELQEALRAERASLTPELAGALDGFLRQASPPVWVVGWVTAAGFLGKFISFFRLLLAAVVGAFAFIALIVVTIGMTIATLQRTATIGTLRAIGAQRGFVVAMVMTETVVLSLVFGALGAAVGAGVVAWLHQRGIPAFRDELYFFFSGPVLRPQLSAGVVVLSVLVTLVVSVLAVLFPTYLATRVPPVTAMQAAE